MQSSPRQVYFVSNGTAITSETLGISLLAQFPDHQFQMRTIPFVDTLEKAHKIRDEINNGRNEANHLPCHNKRYALQVDEFGRIVYSLAVRRQVPCQDVVQGLLQPTVEST